MYKTAYSEGEFAATYTSSICPKKCVLMFTNQKIFRRQHFKAVKVNILLERSFGFTHIPPR
jgi:hypothetical protein